MPNKKVATLQKCKFHYHSIWGGEDNNDDDDDDDDDDDNDDEEEHKRKVFANNICILTDNKKARNVNNSQVLFLSIFR